MRNLFLAAAAASLALPIAPAMAQHRGHEHYHHDRGHHYGQYKHSSRAEWRHYDWNRRPPGHSHYYADRYYVSQGYRPVRVNRYTRVYRGDDGRYYCRRSDGTTGLIVGAALGGLLGHSLSNGNSVLLSTVLGGAAGGLLGREIDRGRVVCH